MAEIDRRRAGLADARRNLRDAREDAYCPSCAAPDESWCMEQEVVELREREVLAALREWWAQGCREVPHA